MCLNLHTEPSDSLYFFYFLQLAKASFLAALSDGLGAKFNAEAGTAWAVFYDVIASGLAAHLS